MTKRFQNSEHKYLVPYSLYSYFFHQVKFFVYEKTAKLTKFNYPCIANFNIFSFSLDLMAQSLQ